MFKIFISILITIALFQKSNVSPCNTSTLKDCVSRSGAAPTLNEVFPPPQIEHAISFSVVDGSLPYNPTVIRPSSITYMKIKGGLIDVEQLFP